MTYLTEAEAKLEPCPFFRSRQIVGYDGAREPIYETLHDACKGSACKIGWRWRDPYQDLLDPDFFRHKARHGDVQPLRPLVGWCGMAGKPE